MNRRLLAVPLMGVVLGLSGGCTEMGGGGGTKSPAETQRDGMSGASGKGLQQPPATQAPSNIGMSPEEKKKMDDMMKMAPTNPGGGPPGTPPRP